MSSDDSSSEDETSRLRESVDMELLPETLFNTSNQTDKSDKNPSSVVKKLPPSLRHREVEDNKHHYLQVKVTPEFQRHVSKKLSLLLDKALDDSKQILKVSHTKEETGGVRLLRTSRNFASVSKSDEQKQKPKKRKLLNDEDWEEREWKKAAEVAVSPAWVLSKEETKHWAPSTKGELEVVKLKCGKT